jgi:hypothetical protein
MRETRITLPELILVAGTRVALGAGLGLLLANRLSRDQRRAAGWPLLLVGALSSIPLAIEIFGGNRLSTASEEPEQITSRSASEAVERLGQRAFAQI